MKKKVFVSTGYFKNHDPLEIYNEFVNHNINSIEFSGGKYLNNKKLKNLNFLNNEKIKIRIHNYFPVPKSKFVINLASENKLVLQKSILQLKKSVLLAKKLNNKYFSFHAGFRIDPKPKYLGKKLEKIKLVDKEKAENIFLKNLKILNNFAKKNKVKLLIENNVINKKNFKIFKGNPLLLTNPDEILKFFKRLPREIGFLLDVGHLKVSAKTENFNLHIAMNKLKKIIKGYHLSENNSLEDQNKNFSNKVWFLNYLKKNLNYYTLEIYNTDIKKIYKTKQMVEGFLNE